MTTAINDVVQGDCLDLLADLPAGCADLIYADPPYGTGRDFGQFGDQWPSGLDGYLDYMRPRLEACHRVLAATGAMWLHCDTTASHYLKVMMDEIWGRGNFRNEIAWCYTAPSMRRSGFPQKHDSLLFYAQSTETSFNWQSCLVPYAPGSIDKLKVPARIFGSVPVDNGAARIGTGKVVEDWWTDIPVAARFTAEYRHYPTQKPEALLKRIVRASSNQGDLVADPFCGSGTALVAAKRLGRRWWGCDLNAEAVALTERRLAVETAPLAGLADGHC